MRRNVGLGVLLALCACGSGSEPAVPEGCARPAEQQLYPRSAGSVFVTGQAATLPFEWSTYRGCPGSVQARVEAPGGALLEAALELEPVDGTYGVRIPGVVRFTPTEAGTWRVLLRVDGVEGEAVSKVLVAADRSDAPVRELPRWCQALHGTTRGTLLCDGAVFREGRVVQTLPGESLLATAGNVVWEVYGKRVSRYEDTGTGGLTPAPALSLETDRTQPQTLHATEQELLVVYGGGELVRYVHDEVLGLTKAGVASYPYFTYMDRHFQLRRFEDRAVLVASYGTMSAACYYQAAGTGLTLLPWTGPYGAQWNKCQALSGLAIGMGEAGLWAHDRAGTTGLERLWLYELRGGTLESNPPWELPSLVSALKSQPLSVTTDARMHQSHEHWFVPAWGPHGVVLERYEPSDGFELRAIHGDLVYEISRGTPARTRVYTR